MAKEIVEKFADKGFLLEPILFKKLQTEKSEIVLTFLDYCEKQKASFIITSEFFNSFYKGEQQEQEQEIQQEQLEHLEHTTIEGAQVLILEKKRESESEEIESEKLEVKKEKKEEQEQEEQEQRTHFLKEFGKGNSIKILYSYKEEPKKIVPADFTEYFKNRFLRLREMLAARPELEKITSMGKKAVN